MISNDHRQQLDEIEFMRDFYRRTLTELFLNSQIVTTEMILFRIVLFLIPHYSI